MEFRSETEYVEVIVRFKNPSSLTENLSYAEKSENARLWQGVVSMLVHIFTAATLAGSVMPLMLHSLLNALDEVAKYSKDILERAEYMRQNFLKGKQ